MTPDSYLREILADGARPFRHRAGVSELLGLPADTGVRVSFGATLAGPGFAYLRQSRGSDAEYLPGAAPATGSSWWSQVTEDFVDPPAVASTVDGDPATVWGATAEQFHPSVESASAPAVLIPGVTTRSDHATPSRASVRPESVVDRTQPQAEPRHDHERSGLPAPAAGRPDPGSVPLPGDAARPGRKVERRLAAAPAYPKVAGPRTDAEDKQVDDGQPAEGQPAEERPIEERPIWRRPAEGQPAEGQPVSRRLAAAPVQAIVTERTTVASAVRTPGSRIQSVGSNLADVQVEVPRRSLPARRVPAVRAPADDTHARSESPPEWPAGRQAPQPPAAPRIVVVQQTVAEPGIAAFWERRHLGRLGLRAGVLR